MARWDVYTYLILGKLMPPNMSLDNTDPLAPLCLEMHQKSCIVFCHIGFLLSSCNFDTSKAQSGVCLWIIIVLRCHFKTQDLALDKSFSRFNHNYTHFKWKTHTLGMLEIHMRTLNLKLQFLHSRSFGPFDTCSMRFNSKFGSKGFASRAKVKWQGCGTRTLQAPTYSGLEKRLH